MDIDSLRKINELTKALQQHGISTSSQDAMSKAEQILSPTQERIHAEPMQVKEQVAECADILLERKYKLMLEMNNKRFEETIITLQNNIQTLAQDIAKLKNDIRLMDMKNTTSQQATLKAETQQEQTGTQQKKDCHPRQGNFNPGDISMEKVFYFGHK